ncbi:MAG: hypothetical protein KAT62_01485 [Desulfuromonadales bacterium]|nr:hypothetical protein [Desulfuromonadales bacterium]
MTEKEDRLQRFRELRATIRGSATILVVGVDNGAKIECPLGYLEEGSNVDLTPLLIFRLDPFTDF